jgi:Fic family protein
MNDLPANHTPLEIENGFRQFDLSLEIVSYFLHPDRPFSLRMSHILDLHREAVSGVQEDAGELRSGKVGIHDSKHSPPEPFLVNTLMTEFCDYINDNWHEKTAFYLSAYAMWRLNWIHPFFDGNGRTARTLSYMILCLKLGYIIPGSPTIPAQIEQDKSHYIISLEKADASFITGEVDLSEMEGMIRCMLARQLLSVIDAADGLRGSISN